MELISMRLFLILIVFSATFLSFSGEAAGDLIYRVCAKTDYPRICESTLRNITGAPHADLKRLARMMLDEAMSEAEECMSTMLKLLKRPKINPARRDALNFCRLRFAVAVSLDAEAIKDFDKGTYAKAALEVGNEANAGSECDSKFKAPKTGPSPLPDGGLKHRQLARVTEQIIYQIVSS